MSLTLSSSMRSERQNSFHRRGSKQFCQVLDYLLPAWPEKRSLRSTRGHQSIVESNVCSGKYGTCNGVGTDCEVLETLFTEIIERLGLTEETVLQRDDGAPLLIRNCSRNGIIRKQRNSTGCYKSHVLGQVNHVKIKDRTRQIILSSQCKDNRST